MDENIIPESKDALSAAQAQAIVEGDRRRRIQHTLAEMEKIFEADQTEITVVMILRPGQYPTAEIQVVAK